jgi:hypothetical protein
VLFFGFLEFVGTVVLVTVPFAGFVVFVEAGWTGVVPLTGLVEFEVVLEVAFAGLVAF